MVLSIEAKRANHHKFQVLYQEQLDKLHTLKIEYLPAATETAAFLREQTPPEICDTIVCIVPQYEDVLPDVLASLATVDRWNGRISFNDFTETDLEHALGMFQLALTDYERFPQAFTIEQWAEIFLLIFLHDLPEVFSSDVSQGDPTHAETHDERHAREKAGLRLLLRTHEPALPETINRIVMELYENYENRENCLSAQTTHFFYVKLLDSIDGNGKARDHFDNVEEVKKMYISKFGAELGLDKAAEYILLHSFNRLTPEIAKLNTLFARLLFFANAQLKELISYHKTTQLAAYKEAGYADELHEM